MGTSARAVALTGSDQAVKTSHAIYRGFSIRETSGSAAATVRVYDHASSASGTLIDTIQLAAGESAREWYDGGGIWVENGIYVDVVSGAVEGSLRVG
jgi:hypothetical protein